MILRDFNHNIHTFINSSYINLAHWRLGSNKRAICFLTRTSNGTYINENQNHHTALLRNKTSLRSKSKNTKRESTSKRKGNILFSESENNKPTSGTNSGVLGPVAFWMIVWMSASVKSSQGSTSCTTNHVT